MVALVSEGERAMNWIVSLGVTREEAETLSQQNPDNLRLLNDAWARLRLVPGGVLIPKAGEVVFGHRSNASLHRFHQVRQRSYHGGSVRLMKGVWLHGGSSGTTGVSRQLWHHDTGALYLTTRRLYYAGSSDNLEFRFAKLDKFPTWYRDGYLSLPHGQREELFHVGKGDDANAWGTFLDFLIRSAQSGG